MKPANPSAQDRENALKGELAREILRRFGTLRLRVTGQSMLPSVWPGDMLLIQRCALAEIFPGDIVLYARNARLVAHRVICAGADLEDPHLVTQGDALPTPDSPISTAEFLGRVSQINRRSGSHSPVSVVTFRNRLVASAARYSTIAARLLVHLHAARPNSGEPKALC